MRFSTREDCLVPVPRSLAHASDGTARARARQPAAYFASISDALLALQLHTTLNLLAPRCAGAFTLPMQHQTLTPTTLTPTFPLQNFFGAVAVTSAFLPALKRTAQRRSRGERPVVAIVNSFASRVRAKAH